MTERSCLAVVVWMFAVATIYACIALPPLFRTAFLQWLGFYAVLIAPLVFMELNQCAISEKEKP